MREELARVGVAFERVSGIDGAALTRDEVDLFHGSRPGGPSEGWLSGEIGCFLSHFETWRRIASGGAEWAAIFEDDVRVAHDLGCLLGTVDWIPAGADIVRLEANRRMRLSGGVAIEAAPGRKVFRALSGTSGAAGYLLSKRTAARLIETQPALHIPVDLFLFKPKVSCIARKLNRHQVVPAVCVQDGILEGGGGRLKSLIKTRATRGRGYRENSSPLLQLWPIQRYAVPFRA